MKALVTAAAFMAMTTVAVSAEETDGLVPEGYAPTGEFEQCLKTYEIREFDGQSDGRTLLVTLRSGDVYRSVLKNRCSGLRQNRTISYSTDSRQELCSSDSISVQNVGSTLRDATVGGIRCPLSDFEKLAKLP